jgi:putative methyltransferase (TIGR04325 family)
MNNEFFIWEGVYNNFYEAKAFADGFGFSGETYNLRAYDAAKECLDAINSNLPIPFFHKQRSVILPPIVAMMMNSKSKLNIFDFGGGLGIGYMTLKESISDLDEKINYTIMELSFICKQGKELHNGNINFVEDFSNLKEFNLVHSSSAIQYIDDWKGLISKLCSFNASNILMSDVFAGDFKSYVTLQNYYGNKIPHWFFSINEFIGVFEDNGYFLDMKSCVSAKRLDIDDLLPMTNFSEQYRLNYTSHMLFKKKN